MRELFPEQSCCIAASQVMVHPCQVLPWQKHFLLMASELFCARHGTFPRGLWECTVPFVPPAPSPASPPAQGTLAFHELGMSLECTKMCLECAGSVGGVCWTHFTHFTLPSKPGLRGPCRIPALRQSFAVLSEDERGFEIFKHCCSLR